ncbi:MAG TPA: hypothetical protein VGM67_18770 [Gemmatimonadaceae bacterium]|jgi:hypothetical protein
MRLARWHRVVATVLALWLPFVVGEPAMAHPCPMHSPTAMQHGAAHHHESMPGDSKQSQHHECDCIGYCASSAVASDTPATSIVSVVVSQWRDAGRIHETHVTPRNAVADVGLYTTGPPLSAHVL